MKQTRTELNLTVSTDYTHDPKDVIESVRQRIEVTSFHLQSLFSFIKRSAREVEGAVRDEGNQSVNSFCFDLMNFADLGEGLALSIWATISDLTELQTTGEPETSAANVTSDETGDGENYPLESTDSSRTLAGVISALITNPNVPPQISEALQDAVNEIMNASKQTEVLEYEKSSEYIAKVLRDYQSE